ncbi:MAG: ribosomal protein S18-alanine N-acetyltransferase [Erysipelotrichaceae bacterium]|nr:ribosomal protein S18-alanine N-acetyltransferase [Erysipelotrichaceae bacterium]
MIRRMTLNDLDQVLRIEETSFSSPWTYENFRYELEENEFSRCYVYEEEGRILGYSMMWILFENADINNIAVLPEERRKGIALKLMEHMEEEAVKEGAEFLHLEVRVSNEAAISLYKKLGFEFLRLRKGYYSDPAEDGYDMMKGVILNEEDTGDREQL